MNFRYLLDTNVVSDLVRNPAGMVATHIAKIGAQQVCTSIVVACELRFGAIRRGSVRLAAQLETVLRPLDVLPLGVPSDRAYGDLRADLERRGLPIGTNDMLIAAHALAIGCTLVTDNEREFLRVPGLTVENWLRPVPH